MIRAADALAHIRRLGLPSYGDDEVTFIAKAVLKYQPDMVFDWGTNVGVSARIFHEVTRLAGIPCVVHTIELPEGSDHREFPGHRYAEWLAPVLGQVKLHRGDGAVVAGHLVLEHHPVRPLFFADGDHLAPNVYRELRLISAIAPQGLILVHDTQAHAGDGVRDFMTDGHRLYRADFLASQAGLTALWPRVHVTA